MYSRTSNTISFIIRITALVLAVVLLSKCTDTKSTQPIKDKSSERKSYTEEYLDYWRDCTGHRQVAEIECRYETIKVLKEISQKLDKFTPRIP
jgi:hypothetical protein